MDSALSTTITRQRQRCRCLLPAIALLVTLGEVLALHAVRRPDVRHFG